MSKHILHPSVFLKGRDHTIDIHVYPVCKELWDVGVKTYFSCQGGPGFKHGNGKFVPDGKAYVVVRNKDCKKAMKVLKKLGLNPVQSNVLRYLRVAINFDCSEEAKNIPLIVEKNKITYKLLKKEA